MSIRSHVKFIGPKEGRRLLMGNETPQKEKTENQPKGYALDIKESEAD